MIIDNRDAFGNPPPGCFILLANMIVPKLGFLPCGIPMPMTELVKIPDILRKYTLEHDPDFVDPESEQQVVANFQLNQKYELVCRISDYGLLSPLLLEQQRAQQREAAEAADALAAELEHALANPDAQTAAALKIIAANQEAAVGLEIAQAEAAAKRGEMETEAGRQFVEEDPMLVDDDRAVPVSPTIHPEPDSKPKLRKRYVRRFGKMVHATKKVRYKVGEVVFIKDSAREFQPAGQVNKRGSLPLIYLKDQV